MDWRQALVQVQVAMMLLTRLPAGTLSSPVPKLADAAWAFPVVGLVVGALSAMGLAMALWFGLPPELAAGGALIISVLATGGLHEDGLADLADGFGGGHTRARKLEIMRDSRIGSYGTLALILSVGMRWQALAVVAAVSPVSAVSAIIAVAMISRAGLPAIMVAMPPARDDGLGRSASGGDWTSAAIAAAIGAAAAMVLLRPGMGLGAALVAMVVLAGLGALALRQIGGQTGDVLGAGQQVSEIAVWLMVAAMAAA